MEEVDDTKRWTLRAGLWLLAGAVGMGVLGDALLRATAPGVNVLLCLLALLATVAALARRLPDGWGGVGRWPALAAAPFAAAFAWRDSPTLHALDALALLACLSLAAVRLRREARLARVTLTDCAGGALRAAAATAFGGLGLVFRDIPWREVPRGGGAARLLAAVGLGLALALPLLLVFGGLLASADPVFGRLLHQVMDLDFTEFGSHLTLTALGALAVGGYLRALFGARRAAPEERQRPGFLSLGTVEVGVVLGLLDALFLAFVAVQARYFFGGAQVLRQTAGLTYAQYARGGFFELAAVAALVLPLLLLLHWLHRAGGPAGRRVFGALAGLQVGLLFVIMASAVQRMHLYQEEYGQTELRLYVTAFMAWLALVFLWLSVTVLPGRRERFAGGALAAALGVIAALHVLDPDALIVRTNAALVRSGRPFDIAYAASLSADAAPALLAARPLLPPAQARAVSDRLTSAWAPPRRPDWRSWNWSRTVAARLAAQERDKGNGAGAEK